MSAAAAHTARPTLRRPRRQADLEARRKNLLPSAPPRTQRLTPMRLPLRPTNLAGILSLTSFTSSISFTSFRMRTLKLSCSFFPDCRPLFSIASALFDKNTRGGILFPILTSHRSRVTNHVRRAPKAQKRVSLSPFAATLTHSLFCNPFVCHSYANTRDDGAEPHKNLKLHLKSDSQKWLSHFASWDIIARLIPHQETS